MPEQESNTWEQRRKEREKRRMEREQLRQGSPKTQSSKPQFQPNSSQSFSFDFKILIPLIVAVLGVVEIFFFSSIEPLNFVFALIIFILAGLMFKQYFSRDELIADESIDRGTYSMQSEEKEAVSGVLGKMDLYKGVESSSSPKSSFNLDDFLKSFPDEKVKKKKRFATVMDLSPPEPEKRVEDKLLEKAKQNQAQKNITVSKPKTVEQKPQTQVPVSQPQKVSFKSLKENTLRELKELAKKKKK